MIFNNDNNNNDNSYNDIKLKKMTTAIYSLEVIQGYFEWDVL